MWTQTRVSVPLEAPPIERVLQRLYVKIQCCHMLSFHFIFNFNSISYYTRNSGFQVIKWNTNKIAGLIDYNVNLSEEIDHWIVNSDICVWDILQIDWSSVWKAKNLKKIHKKWVKLLILGVSPTTSGKNWPNWIWNYQKVSQLCSNGRLERLFAEKLIENSQLFVYFPYERKAGKNFFLYQTDR